MISKLILLLSLTVTTVPHLKGQTHYWVDRNHPMNKSPRFCSEWLEACSYELTPAEVAKLGLGTAQKVLQFEPLSTGGEIPTLSFTLEQIEGHLLIDKGITGRGVKIGVIDGGFLDAPEDQTLSHLFENERIASYKDYITPDYRDYGGNGSLDDKHGNGVLKMIAGIDPASKIQFGLATEATFYLARTDHGAYEKRLEEDYLIEALEAMEREDVRLVNVSLGYAKGYKNTSENYTPEDMDGSSMVAQAIDHAFYEKNMLVVVAAGNEGNDKKWRVLSTPGDSKGALTVGATKLKIWDRMDYSSIGPEYLPYNKPDIACYSSYGTSYATPIITGLAACIMQQYPDLTAAEIKEAIMNSGNLYPYANNYLGNGVPQISQLLRILSNEPVPNPELVISKKKTFEIETEQKRELIAVYHKKDSSRVLSREISKIKDHKIKIWREKEAAFTTVLLGKKVIEIEWQN